MQLDTRFLDDLVEQAEKQLAKGDQQYAIECFRFAISSYRKLCAPVGEAVDMLGLNRQVQDEDDDGFSLAPNPFEEEENLKIVIPPTAASGVQAPHTEWIQVNKDAGLIVKLEGELCRALGKHFKNILFEKMSRTPVKIGPVAYIRTDEALIWQEALKHCAVANADPNPEKSKIVLNF